MSSLTNNQRIEENFRTFNDKYVELFADIKKGLEAMGSLYSNQISSLNGIIAAFSEEDYSKACQRFLEADLSSLIEESFEDNLKLNSDLNSLKVRMANLNLLEADATH
ncbi:hypothetical protein [Marinospirillum insulare]|uniref:Uncharacterized protein n=1 Tax=Marinospirillum insulare TaxID=217169 RepID=A0ABQ5ZZA3_9GAMM|nr:hypothetical protein [Marinospirillum insulare]GLR63333.1 hypothetical protein GCM10007878_07680 [Marinospirillum insulare]